jgi:hypothetical protein
MLSFSLTGQSLCSFFCCEESFKLGSHFDKAVCETIEFAPQLSVGALTTILQAMLSWNCGPASRSASSTGVTKIGPFSGAQMRKECYRDLYSQSARPLNLSKQ